MSDPLILIDQLNIGVAMMDHHARFVYANSALCDTLEIELDHLLGMPARELVIRAERSIWAQGVARRASGAHDPYRVRAQAPGGRVVSGVVKPQPIVDESGRYLGSLGLFVTSRSRPCPRAETAGIGARPLFEVMRAARSFSRGCHGDRNAGDALSGQENTAGLTAREVEIARLLLAGHAARAASERLAISIHTVNAHLRGLRKKVGAHNIVELIAKLRALVPADDPDTLA